MTGAPIVCFKSIFIQHEKPHTNPWPSLHALHTQTYCLCLSSYSDNKCLLAAMLGRPRLGSRGGSKKSQPWSLPTSCSLLSRGQRETVTSERKEAAPEEAPIKCCGHSEAREITSSYALNHMLPHSSRIGVLSGP